MPEKDDLVESTIGIFIMSALYQIRKYVDRNEKVHIRIPLMCKRYVSAENALDETAMVYIGSSGSDCGYPSFIEFDVKIPSGTKP